MRQISRTRSGLEGAVQSSLRNHKGKTVSVVGEGIPARWIVGYAYYSGVGKSCDQTIPIPQLKVFAVHELPRALDGFGVVSTLNDLGWLPNVSVVVQRIDAVLCHDAPPSVATGDGGRLLAFDANVCTVPDA
jgi:hypothetical protein